MNRYILPLLVSALGIAMMAPLAGQATAMEEMKDTSEAKAKSGGEFASCDGWLNCSAESPNFTGVCCRICKDDAGKTVWDCKRNVAGDAARGASAASDVALGEATLTGIVTAEGILKVDEGKNYRLAGTKLQVDELKSNMGRKVEIKGAVQETGGKATLEVESYDLVYSEVAAPAGEGGLSSCSTWLNCDRRPPNYTGTCCRQCYDKAGAKVWDCQVFSGVEHFDRTEW